jgi:hypothetical protein
MARLRMSYAVASADERGKNHSPWIGLHGSGQWTPISANPTFAIFAVKFPVRFVCFVPATA